MQGELYSQIAELLNMEAQLQIAVLFAAILPDQWTECLELLTRVRLALDAHSPFSAEAMISMRRDIMAYHLAEFQS